MIPETLYWDNLRKKKKAIKHEKINANSEEEKYYPFNLIYFIELEKKIETLKMKWTQIG